MHKLLASIFSLLVFLSPAFAGQADDADFIVNQHMKTQQSEQQLDQLRNQFVDTMRPAIESFGAEIIDAERFTHEMTGNFHSEMRILIREAWVAFYSDHFTSEELAKLSNFYQTEEGRAFLQSDLTNNTLPDYIAFLKDGPGAPLLAHIPEFLQTLQKIKTEAEKGMSGVNLLKIADVMEMEEVVKFHDETQRSVVVDAIRNAE